MRSAGFSAFTIQERPELLDEVYQVCAQAWPDFLVHDPIVNQYWPDLYRVCPDFQFALVEESQSSVVGVGNSVPISWDKDSIHLPDEGVDWVLGREFKGQPATQPAKNQVALQIVVKESFRGRGLSTQLIQKMIEIGRIHGLKNLFAPVRPTQKCHYPLVPMEKYIHWKNDKGLPFDSWIRIHHLQGAKIVKVCPQALQISGSLAEWESWTKMRFPESGPYVVPGALVPIEIDCEHNRGVYVEPNVWMHHPIK